ncbi:MAG TPA: ribonuclease E/G [Acetobacteraceae bacterium]|nr:ribonuclease E/G [Acetobacteraceae bacterium]
MSVTRRILASAAPGEVRVALIENDRLAEAWFDRPGLRGARIGDLQRARITARVPAMSGAFVALAEGETGFLPDTAADAEDARGRAAALAEGRILAVRITREAQGGKGPRVTARLDAAERSRVGPGPAPALIARGPDAALRLAQAWPEAELVADDAALAAALRPALGARVALSRAPAFDDGLEAEFASLLEPEVPLPGGGRLLIHPTPGLTAVDVDAGSAVADSRRAVNAAAVAEAARQIRLRNLGGAILLDAAGLAPRARAALVEPLRAALAADPVGPRALGVTGLGLIEIVRPRLRAPLHEVLGTPVAPWPASVLTQGLAALRQAARDAAARPAVVIALRAAPALLRAIGGLPGALEDYAARAGRPLRLEPDSALPPGAWEIMEA